MIWQWISIQNLIVNVITTTVLEERVDNILWTRNILYSMRKEFKVEKYYDSTSTFPRKDMDKIRPGTIHNGR